MKNIFLTGAIHIGKTTALNSFLNSFHGTIGGFKTFPVVQNNEKIGFSMKAINPSDGTMPAFIAKKNEENNWAAILGTFDDLGVHILKKALDNRVDLIIMDELGFFEENAYLFQKAVYECLDSKIPVLGVIKKANSGFLNKLRERKDLEIIEVNEENRDEIPNKISELLGCDNYV